MQETMTGLAAKDVMATIAVRDLAAARNFYERTLGLTPTETREATVAGYRCGHSTLLVYQSAFAGTNRATAATWPVGGDIAAIVGSLKQKGVVFEHYDMPGMKHEGDLHVSGSMKAAWFRDPDGNILGLVTG